MIKRQNVWRVVIVWISCGVPLLFVVNGIASAVSPAAKEHSRVVMNELMVTLDDAETGLSGVGIIIGWDKTHDAIILATGKLFGGDASGAVIVHYAWQPENAVVGVRQALPDQPISLSPEDGVGLIYVPRQGEASNGVEKRLSKQNLTIIADARFLRHGDRLLVAQRVAGAVEIMKEDALLLGLAPGDSIQFNSVLLGAAFSGGWLLNGHQQLIGLIPPASDIPGVAYRLDRVLPFLQESVALKLNIAPDSHASITAFTFTPSNNPESRMKWIEQQFVSPTESLSAVTGVAWFDVNDDGEKDLLFELYDEYGCGTAGCTNSYLVALKVDHGFSSPVTLFEGCGSQLIFQEGKHGERTFYCGGMRDDESLIHGAESPAAYCTLDFEKKATSYKDEVPCRRIDMHVRDTASLP